MHKGRLEAFSDGVIAVAITIMVLELKPPHGAEWSVLKELLPTFLVYVLSFVFLGIYWNNHHHMFQAAERVDGRILWANLHLLFWLTLVPFSTGWMGDNGLAPLPIAAYGVVLLFAAVAYTILQAAIIRQHGKRSKLATAVGKDLKGKLSLLGYASAIPLAYVSPWVAIAIYVAVALVWLVPDTRIEEKLEK